jgi:hypothetical protein
MSIDRGFIKWQPFQSVISTSEIMSDLKKREKLEKPILFPEEMEEINKKIIEAYYSKNKVMITIYEQNKIKKIEATITKIDSTLNIIELNNSKKISFYQIININ